MGFNILVTWSSDIFKQAIIIVSKEMLQSYVNIFHSRTSINAIMIAILDAIFIAIQHEAILEDGSSPPSPIEMQWQWTMGICKQFFCPFSVCSSLFSLNINHKNGISWSHLSKFLISALLNAHNVLCNLLILFLD